jgi:PilZ domain
MIVGDFRRAFRYKGKLRVCLDRGSGFTRDFSLDGVYFFTPVCFAAGETIEFTLNLDHEPNENQVPVRCNGRILRVEPQEYLFGIAVELKTYSLPNDDNCQYDLTG